MDSGALHVSSLRSRARRLLRDFRADDPDRSAAAAARLATLRGFARSGPDTLLTARDRVRLKHALAVVAREHGHASWVELKRHVEQDATPSPAMYEPGMDNLLNSWFARYEDAREARDRHGGFLLPFRTQFLVCEQEGIRVLGLDPDDPDWARIGHDWVTPSDREAWLRLANRRQALIAARGAARP